MKTPDKKTEDLLKDKLNNREFAFDEAAWAGMENLLNAQENKKKRGFFWIFSASMFVVLVAGAFWILKPEFNNNSLLKLYGERGGIEKNDTNSLNEGENAMSFDENNAKASKNSQNERNELLAQNDNTPEYNKSKLEQNKIKVEDNKTKLEDNKIMSENNKIKLEGNKIMSENNKIKLEENKNMLENNKIKLEENKNMLEEKTAIISEIKADEALDSAQSTEQAAEMETNNLLSAPGKETKNAWGVLVGAGFNTSYKNVSGFHGYPDRSKKGGIGFVAGFSYEGEISKRFAIGVNALYVSRGALNSDKEFINSEYGFGYETDKTIISPQVLHYFNVPVYLKFNVSPRHHILLGGAYSQLLAITYKQEHLIENNFGSNVIDTKTKTGNLNGFKNYDLSAFIGYELTLFDRINAGVRFNYGFIDITDNKYFESIYFNNNHYDRNISLQLHLKYDILKH